MLNKNIKILYTNIVWRQFDTFNFSFAQMICFSRLDNIAVLAALQAIQASSQQQRSYIGAEMPIPPPPLSTAPVFSELEDKKTSSTNISSSASTHYPRDQNSYGGGILHQPQHVRTSSGGILMKRSMAGPSVNFQENHHTEASFTGANRMTTQSNYQSEPHHQAGSGDIYPLRDVPSSSGGNSASSFCPIPPPPMTTSLATLTSMPSMLPPPGKLPTIYPPPPPSSSSTSGGGDQPSMSADFPLAEPPLEYSGQAQAASKQDTAMFSWSKHKTTSESATPAPDVKRGLLSSILEKVRSKDSESQSVGGTTSSSSKESNKAPPGSALATMSSNQARSLNIPSLAPLASSESLATTTASLGSVGSTSSVIHKPFEPPGLGKPSRVTPVGLDEADENDGMSAMGDRFSATESMSINQDTSSVEVLSVIRFNKSVSSAMGGGGSSLGGRIERATSKISNASNLSSEKAFSSSSETAVTSNPSTVLHSLTRQRSAEDMLQDNLHPCPACDANAASRTHQGRHSTAIQHNNTSTRRRARSEGRRRSRELRHNQKVHSHDTYSSNHHVSKSRRNEKMYDSEDEADISTSVLTNPSLQRRLSAPEIDDNSMSALSTTGGTFGTTDIPTSEDTASSIISAKLLRNTMRPMIPMPMGSAKGYSRKQSSNRHTAVHPYDSAYYSTISNLQYKSQRKSRSSPPLDKDPGQVIERSKQRHLSYSEGSDNKTQGNKSSMAQDEYHTSSDSEVGSGSRPGSRATRSRSPRYSLGSIDSQDLQKAVAHIQETLKLRMERRESNDPQKQVQDTLTTRQHKSEVVAVVHRSGESPLKEYLERQRENRISSPAESTSSRKSSTMEELGPYDTIKPSRMKKGGAAQKNNNSMRPSKRGNNGNNNTVNTNRKNGGEHIEHETKTYDSSDKPLIRVQPPSLPPKPSSLKPTNPVESSTATPRIGTLERSDSFEGHEEAVRTLVEAVNESRKFEANIAAIQKAYPGRSNAESPSDQGRNHSHTNPS